MADLSVEVNNLNYDRAHRYYLSYYTGKGSDADIEMGKAVAASSKWQSFITQWQSEDATTYLESDEVDKNGEKVGMSQKAKDEIDELNEDGSSKNNKGGLAAGGAVGGVTAGAGIALALFAKTGLKALTGNGTIIAAGIYAGVGVVYTAISEVMRSQVKKNRELQDRYVAKAEEHLHFNYEAAEAKSQEITDMVSTQDALAKKVGEKAKGDTNLSNAVAEATATSNTNVHTAALGQGDKVAGAAYDQLEGINTEMLDTIGEYDSIMAEVNTNKSIVNSIKTEMPEFKKQRSNDKITEYLFAAGGAAGALAGVMGAMAAPAAAATTALAAGAVAAIAIALFVVGIACFGAAAVMSGMEASKQTQGEQTANTKVDESNNAANNAGETSSKIKEQLNASNTMYQSGLNLQKDMDEEDANLNGALA